MTIPDSLTRPSPQRRTGWRRLFPEPTPPHARPQVHPTTAVWAYGALLLIVVLVFGESLVRQLLAALDQGGAPVRAAPNAENFWQVAGPRWTIEVMALVIVGISVWAVATRRRIPVRSVFTPAAGPQRAWGHAWLVFAWALAFCVASLGATIVLERLAPAASGGFADSSLADVVWVSAMQGPTLLTTGLREEIVVVGILVVLLTAARRPTWEIFGIAVVIKLSYHLYYGIPVLGLIPFALGFVWLYHRTGRLWPLIIAHAVYNAGYTIGLIAWTALVTP